MGLLSEQPNSFTEKNGMNEERLVLGKVAADQVVVSDAQSGGKMLMPNGCWGDGRKLIVRNETDTIGMPETLAD